MNTSNYDFPVAAEVLRLHKATERYPDLKEVHLKKRGTNGLPVNDQGKIWMPTNAVKHAGTPLCHRSLGSWRTPRSPSDPVRYTGPLLLEGHEQVHQPLCGLVVSLHHTGDAVKAGAHKEEQPPHDQGAKLCMLLSLMRSSTSTTST
jgi:hypothetical protein